MSAIERPDDFIFNRIKEKLSQIDPVAFCEHYLNLDGKPYRLSKSGYKPHAEIIRYIGIKALEKNSLPIVVLKSRQSGLSTIANALEMYFMGSGLFGTDDKPPIRIIHAFPQLDLAASYSKVKLNGMIASSIPEENYDGKGQRKSYMQSLLDTSAPTNDSLQFKQFKGGNHIWIESTGLSAERFRGKQLALDTKIPTPNGFVKLSDVKQGDSLFDENGNICKVIKLHPINISPESYEITFDDGTIVKACADHLWLTYTKRDRINIAKFNRGKCKNAPIPKVKTTKEILATLKVCNNKENNHSIPNCLPVNFSQKDQIIDPYLLGLWLGDGNGGGGIQTADPEILNNFEHRVIPSSIDNGSKSNTYRVVGLTTKLRKLGLLINNHKDYNNVYEKRIPTEYMMGSCEQRLALIQGLMDTDGFCDSNGRIEFTSVIRELSYDVYKLLLSMGIKAHIIENESWLYEKQCKNRFRINFTTKLPVFRLARKFKNQRTKNTATCMSTHRYIKSVKLIEPTPMRCLTVDSPNGLFLITENFIPTHNTADIIFFDEIQEMSQAALGNATKVLNRAQYGATGSGVQVYFGTPKSRNSTFADMWSKSSQQFYHLGCEKCKEYFPLYTPGSNEWEDIWISGFTVRCTHCGCEQDKFEAAERGKWIAANKDPDAKFVGFFINQLFMPGISKEKMMSEKPGVSTINTERSYQNEVLGEFFQGEASSMTPDQVREICGDIGRKFKANAISSPENPIFLGVDIGSKNDIAQLADNDKSRNQGQSYSTAVVLEATGPTRLEIIYACKFKRNDLASKKGIIDEIMRRYSCNLGVCDIGHAQDLNEILSMEYGDKFLSSRVAGKLNNHIKFHEDITPKEIRFEKDFYIGQLYEQMKKGSIRFPLGDYEAISWLINHCTSMEIKPSMSRGGDFEAHYIKGSAPNDGFMALLNAYLAYKFYISNGFKIQVGANNTVKKEQALIITGYVPKMR
jgi:hypothetical protein